MGNCQASTEAATVVIQHAGGRVERLYCSTRVSEVMKDNPGHHVALVTFCFSKTTSATTTTTTHDHDHDHHNNKCEEEEAHDQGATAAAAAAVRLTRIKLLKPKDTLLLGHVYRLVSSQEVAKALRARKYEKMIKKEQQQEIRQKQFKPRTSRTDDDHGQEIMRDFKVAMQEKDGQRSTHPTTTRARQWRPSLQSISEIVS